MTNIALDQRRRFVGGSEAASLFYCWRLPDGTLTYRHMFEDRLDGAECIGCLSSHTTGYRLFHEKTGALDPDNLDEVERIQAGQYLEPAIAAWAKDRFGLNIRKVHRYITHPSIAGMGHSRDYEEVAQGFPPVEIKNIDFLVFRDNYEATGDEITDAPFDKLLQVQAQMAGTNAPYGWLIANVAGNKLYRMKVARHEPTIARIEDAVRALWLAMAEGRAPAPIYDVDAEAVIALHQSATAYEPPLDLRSHNRLAAACAEYKEAAAAEKDAEGRKQALKAEIFQTINDADKVLASGFRLSAGVQADSLGTLITPDMVGKRIGGRSGFRRLTVTPIKDTKK